MKSDGILFQSQQVSASIDHCFPPDLVRDNEVRVFNSADSFCGSVLKTIAEIVAAPADGVRHLVIIRAHGVPQTGGVIVGSDGSSPFNAGDAITVPELLPRDTLFLIQACWGAYPGFIRFLGGRNRPAPAVAPLVALYADEANRHAVEVERFLSFSDDAVGDIAVYITMEGRRMIARRDYPADWAGLLIYLPGNSELPKNLPGSISDAVERVDAEVVANVEQHELAGPDSSVFVSKDGRTWMADGPLVPGMRYRVWLQSSARFPISLPNRIPRHCTVYQSEQLGPGGHLVALPRACREAAPRPLPARVAANQRLVHPDGFEEPVSESAPCQFCGWGAARNRRIRDQGGRLRVVHEVFCGMQKCEWQVQTGP